MNVNVAPPSNVLMPEVDFAREEGLNIHEKLEKLRAHGPVVPVNYFGKRVWLLLDFKEVTQAFLNNDEFDPGPGYTEMVETSMGRTLQTLSGDVHRRSRALAAPPFAANKVRAYVESMIEPIAHELLDRIEGKQDVDFVDAFCRPFPFTVITRLLGIPVEDEHLFLHWAVKLIDHPWDPEGAMAAKAGFDAYMTKLIHQHRANPNGEFISLLTEAEFEGEKLGDEPILSFFRLLFPAGSDTTYKNAGSLFAAVLSNPDFIAMAKGSDAERAALVTEGLRWEPPTSLLPRMAAKDIEFSGQKIKAGDWCLFGVTAANNDPKVFPDPRRFDPSRDNREIVTFGKGVHFCLGLYLARRELETALKIVFERYPDMRLKPGVPVQILGSVLRGPNELWVQPNGAD